MPALSQDTALLTTFPNRGGRSILWILNFLRGLSTQNYHSSPGIRYIGSCRSFSTLSPLYHTSLRLLMMDNNFHHLIYIRWTPKRNLNPQP